MNPAISDEKLKHLTRICSADIDLKKGGDRTHYLGVGRSAFLDPQLFFQRYPVVYRLFKVFLAPTVPLPSWKKYLPKPSETVIVNLGCGTESLHPAMINIDFVKFAHVDLVADLSESLPLRDQSIDGLYSNSLLEHLEDPEFLVSEIARVCKPGAPIYVIVPFLYPFHGAPHDYTRWTFEGLQKSFSKDFEIELIRSHGGPFGVVTLCLAHSFSQVFSLGQQKLYSLINFSLLGLFSPLKLLDVVFSRLPFSNVLSTNFYLVAHRKNSVLGMS